MLMFLCGFAGLLFCFCFVFRLVAFHTPLIIGFVAVTKKIGWTRASSFLRDFFHPPSFFVLVVSFNFTVLLAQWRCALLGSSVSNEAAPLSHLCNRIIGEIGNQKKKKK
jgi:hypothetical protein